LDNLLCLLVGVTAATMVIVRPVRPATIGATPVVATVATAAAAAVPASATVGAASVVTGLAALDFERGDEIVEASGARVADAAREPSRLTAQVVGLENAHLGIVRYIISRIL
jgi:hypothetical protein